MPRTIIRGSVWHRLTLREHCRLGEICGPDARVKPHTVRAVLGVLLEHAGPNGLCWPSVTTIAQIAEVSESAVKRSIRVLAAAGAIRRKGLPGAGRTHTARTILVWPVLDRLAGIDSSLHGEQLRSKTGHGGRLSGKRVTESRFPAENGSRGPLKTGHGDPQNHTPLNRRGDDRAAERPSPPKSAPTTPDLGERRDLVAVLERLRQKAATIPPDDELG